MAKKTTRADVAEFLRQRPGWERDRFGHFKQTRADGKVVRIKLQSRSARFELQIVHGDGSKSWIRLASAYYRNIRLNEETGKIEGMTR